MTAGSRGDVAPYTGLGHGLARAGHQVTLVTHARFAPLAEAAGIHFHALPVDPRSELESAPGRDLHRSTTGAGKPARVIAMARNLIGELTDDMVAAAQASDVLLLSATLGALGHTIAAGLGLPSMGVHLVPIAATGEFAPPLTGARSWGRPGNRLAAHAVNQLALRQMPGQRLPGRLADPRRRVQLVRRPQQQRLPFRPARGAGPRRHPLHVVGRQPSPRRDPDVLAPLVRRSAVARHPQNQQLTVRERQFTREQQLTAERQPGGEQVRMPGQCGEQVRLSERGDAESERADVCGQGLPHGLRPCLGGLRRNPGSGCGRQGSLEHADTARQAPVEENDRTSIVGT